MDEDVPNWEDHQACWNFEYRGALGESLLHVLIVCNTFQHTKLAKMLVTLFNNLAIDAVEGDEFKGKQLTAQISGAVFKIVILIQERVHCIWRLLTIIGTWSSCWWNRVPLSIKGP